MPTAKWIRFVDSNSGPVAVMVVPPIRKNYFGYQVREGVPSSYPSECARIEHLLLAFLYFILVLHASYARPSVSGLAFQR